MYDEAFIEVDTYGNHYGLDEVLMPSGKAFWSSVSIVATITHGLCITKFSGSAGAGYLLLSRKLDWSV